MNHDEGPLRLLVLGAGPIGLEATLYGRFLGFEIHLLERNLVVAEGIRRWGPRLLPGRPADMMTPLGVAALESHHHELELPANQATVTGDELVEKYLQPLAETDLIADSLELGCEVESILATDRVNLGEQLADDQDDEQLEQDGRWISQSIFTATGRTQPSRLRTWTGDALLDCTGGWTISVDSPHSHPPQTLSDAPPADARLHGIWQPNWQLFAGLARANPAGSDVLPALAAAGLSVEHSVRWEHVIEHDDPWLRAARLQQAQPGWFVLGSKSYGNTRHFQLADGFAQIRDLYAWLGGRRQLNLYDSVRPLRYPWQ